MRIKGITFKQISVSVVRYNMGKSLFFTYTTHSADSLFYLKQWMYPCYIRQKMHTAVWKQYIYSLNINSYWKIQAILGVC